MELTVELLLRAYVHDVFPMADPDTGEIAWFSPERRGIIPLEAFCVPKSLAREVRKGRFDITSDRAFDRVIRSCARDRDRWNRSWIDEQIIRAYTQLHEHGFAHSVEAWIGDELAGGLYGVHIGGAFFGESMFTRKTNASKICLVHLVHHLRRRGFTLLDTQWVNPHLEQFGCAEIPRGEYLRRLHEAVLLSDVTWGKLEA